MLHASLIFYHNWNFMLCRSPSYRFIFRSTCDPPSSQNGIMPPRGPFGSDFGRQWPDQVWDGRMQPDEGWERSPPSNTSLHQFCLHCHSKIESSLKTTLVYWILPWGCDLISCWNATLLWCRWTKKFFSFKMQRSLRQVRSVWVKILVWIFHLAMPK